MKNKELILCGLSLMILTGCLQTRSNLRGTPPPAGREVKVTPQQQKAADEAIKHEDTNKEFRDLYGRIETVENQMSHLKDGENIKNLENRVLQLETELGLLRTTVSELNAKAKREALLLTSDARAAQKESHKEGEKGPLAEGNKHFDSKKWEDAILAYEEYRKNNAKGKDYAEATLKMGMSFQAMGLKDDAKVFYKEIVEKFPKSKEAETAKAKLKKI